MTSRVRMGCYVTVFLIGLVAIVLWRPIARRAWDRMYQNTVTAVVAALPADERPEATAVCDALWTTIRTRGIPSEHVEAFAEFRRSAWAMLKNQEVTEEEARAFVVRARGMLGELDPERAAVLARTGPAPDTADRGTPGTSSGGDPRSP